MSVGNDLMSTTITSSVKNAITSKIYDTFDGKMDSLYSNFDDCVSAINGLIKADTDKSGNRQ
ncbi:hypothetical protein FACS189459_0260 [Bacilli bacterium]|nr:hypothetical protein FACS189459_0260 [Bacilli bacterium]